MPLTGDAKKDYQRKLMAERRAMQNGSNIPGGSNTGSNKPDVTPNKTLQGSPWTRQELRERLDALKRDYGVYQGIQDWDGCAKVNVERDPLFRALWAKEKGLPESERYWMPARFQNEGASFDVAPRKVKA